MKLKKSDKKLTFNKDTVADLNVQELNGIQGGTHTTFATRFATCTQTCYQTCRITCLQAPGTDCLVPAF